MNQYKTVRFSVGFIAIVIGVALGSLPALAAGGSLQIQNVSPTGAIDPGTQVTFYVSTNGFTDAKFSLTDAFSASGKTVGTIDKAGYFSWTPGIYDAGVHNLTVVATDAFTHSATSTVSIVVASNTLIVSSVAPGPTVAAHRPFSFTISAPGFTTPSYAVYDSYAASTLTPSNVNSSGAFSWTPTTDDLGAHALSVRASDAYGHFAQTTVNVTVVNPAVSVQSIFPGSSAGVGSAVSFTAVASSLSKPSFSVHDSFSGTSTVAASNINSSGVFGWKPAATDLGLHTLLLTATDAYGNAASTTVTLVVTNAPATTGTPASSSAPAASASPSTTASTAAKNYLFTTYLGIGSRGAAVVELQKRLSALGFFSGTATGYYGPLTAASVKQFQAAHGLARVGFVGPGTRAVLNGN